MKTIITLTLLYSLIDKRGTHLEIYEQNDSTRIEIMHRNDTILNKRTFKIK